MCGILNDLRVSKEVISSSRRTNPERGRRRPEEGQKGGQKVRKESQIQKNNGWIPRDMSEHPEMQRSPKTKTVPEEALDYHVAEHCEPLFFNVLLVSLHTCHSSFLDISRYMTCQSRCFRYHFAR